MAIPFRSDAISGSLTRLVDGTSYLAAGSNVSIVSGSTGQITITSTGGSTSPGGSNTQIQFNDSGVFGGSSDLVFESGATPKLSLNGAFDITGSILPSGDLSHDLGSTNNRFANIYTGDLHLRNNKGDWTIVEEREDLIVINNLTGKKFKMGLIPLEE